VSGMESKTHFPFPGLSESGENDIETFSCRQCVQLGMSRIKYFAQLFAVQNSD